MSILPPLLKYNLGKTTLKGEVLLMHRKISTRIKKRVFLLAVFFTISVISIIFRLSYVQIIEGAILQEKALEQHTRDRLIMPTRGRIYDRNLVTLAQSASVATIGVVNAQIKDPEKVARILSERLGEPYEEIYKKVTKKVAFERIKTKVDKQLADEIRNLNLPGVKVDEDSKRYYPYKNLASHVLGFVGKDNQGIVGLEVKYDQYLAGRPGKILMETNGKGERREEVAEIRIAPVDGYHLVTTIDLTLQQYAEQALEKVVKAKGAKRGSIILMNPQTGEIYALANKPDFDLNDPFTINNEELLSTWNLYTEKEQQDMLNQMWRNFAINDTYEPGSTFKIFTSAMGLEESVVTESDTFNCGGSRVIAGRTIKCWRSPRSHGHQTFVQGVQNSCNPVFMDLAERLGAKKFYQYMLKFGFDKKTNIDLPGEAVGIMHQEKNIGPVELATMSFGQSFQITPIQLVTAASAVVNGGYMVTPHFAQKVIDDEGNTVCIFEYPKGKQVIKPENSERMKAILESVVSEGTGNKAYMPGYRIGGKTATSQKLPRGSRKYIASFLGFAPAENPVILGLVIIDEPQGVYYGGTVAGPVMQEVFANALPYLGVKPVYNEKEMNLEEVKTLEVPSFEGMTVKEAKTFAHKQGIILTIEGDGEVVLSQFPKAGEVINKQSKIILYTQ